MDDYHYVYHKETDEQAFRLQGGEFEGVVYSYKNVHFPIYDDNGDLVEPDMMVEIPLTFQYEVLYNKDGIVNEKSHERFNKVIGDILMNVIDEGIEHDQIKINQPDRNNDPQQSSL
jgi:hypothetical protein